MTLKHEKIMADILEPLPQTKDELLTNPSQTNNPSPPNTTDVPSLPSLPTTISLANFSSVEWKNYAWRTPYLNSPRSVEICKLNGVTVDDLLPKPFEHFLDLVQRDNTMEVVATKTSDIAMLRYERGEISRRKLLRTLKGERDRAIMVEGLGGKKKKKKKDEASEGKVREFTGVHREEQAGSN